MDLDPCIEAGVRGRGALDDAKCTTGETDGGHGGVLDLDAFVSEPPGPGEHLDGLAEEPHQQVDRVDALVHQGSAPVEGPGAAPPSRVVVRLAAPPGDGRDAGA